MVSCLFIVFLEVISEIKREYFAMDTKQEDTSTVSVLSIKQQFQPLSVPMGPRGTTGTPLTVQTNLSALKFKNFGNGVRYLVTIRPNNVSKKLLLRVMEIFRSDYYPDRYPVFDSLKFVLYSSTMLPFGTDITGDVTVMNEEQEKSFEISIKLVGTVDLDILNKYFESIQNAAVSSLNINNAVECVMTILRDAPTYQGITMSRPVFFTKQKDQIVYLEGGTETYQGFTPSTILGWKPFVSVNITPKVSSIHYSIISLIMELCPGISPNLNEPLTGDNFVKVDNFLRGLKIKFALPKDPTSSRTWRVIKLEKPPNEKYFKINGLEVTVADYFKTTKKYNLKFPNMPCVWVGSKNKRIFVPIELCAVIENQKTKYEMTPIQNLTATSTTAYKQTMLDAVKATRINEKNPCIREFGISVNEELLPREGVSRPQTLHRGISLANWGLICLDATTEKNSLLLFVNKLIQQGKLLGMNVSKPKKLIFLNKDFQTFINENKDLEMLIIIIPSKKSIYNEIKSVAELKVGTLTQCVCSSTLFKSMTAINNLLLKINIKLNGINHILEVRPKCLDRPCMIMGASVAYCKTNTLSVAAIASSHYPQASQYNIVWCSQGSEKMIITDFADAVKEQLMTFYDKNNATKPEHIIYFRDDVVQEDYFLVLKAELSAIRQACIKIQPNDMYQPKITFITLKQHQTTHLLPTNTKQSEDRSLNVPVGTCVDTEITNPTAVDFYQHSRSRPTKYSLLWDDSDMSEDDLKQLTYYLCYISENCSTSLNCPAPVKYARLAAKRFKVYYNNCDVKNLKSMQFEANISSKLKEDLPMFFV